MRNVVRNCSDVRAGSALPEESAIGPFFTPVALSTNYLKVWEIGVDSWILVCLLQQSFWLEKTQLFPTTLIKAHYDCL